MPLSPTIYTYLIRAPQFRAARTSGILRMTYMSEHPMTFYLLRANKGLLVNVNFDNMRVMGSERVQGGL